MLVLTFQRLLPAALSWEATSFLYALPCLAPALAKVLSLCSWPWCPTQVGWMVTVAFAGILGGETRKEWLQPAGAPAGAEYAQVVDTPHTVPGPFAGPDSKAPNPSHRGEWSPPTVSPTPALDMEEGKEVCSCVALVLVRGPLQA